MLPLHLTNAAIEDIAGIWHYTATTYDRRHARAYSSLIKVAIRDIREDPSRPTTQARDELVYGVRSYHVRLCKHRVSPRIGNPRHLIFYTITPDDYVLVLRVLHERMDFKRHINLE